MVRSFFPWVALTFLTAGCGKQKAKDTLYVATSADYPPFEYEKEGRLTGFDIELAEKVASFLGKKIVFKNIAFSGILPAIEAGQADIGVSAFRQTEERLKNFDFSEPYYGPKAHSYAVIFRKDTPINNRNDLKNRKIAVQLGTTDMPQWMQAQGAHITYIDLATQSIESLKNGVIDGVMVEGCQKDIFCKDNPTLGSILFKLQATPSSGYRIVLPKGSELTAKINQAIEELRRTGFLDQLQKKWMEAQP